MEFVYIDSTCFIVVIFINTKHYNYFAGHYGEIYIILYYLILIIQTSCKKRSGQQHLSGQDKTDNAWSEARHRAAN